MRLDAFGAAAVAFGSWALTLVALLGFRRPEQETAAMGVAEGRAGDEDDALTGRTSEESRAQ